jgi:endonuclease/exonuclease/phosphatase family metal-dependent hydrolase
LQGWIAQRRAEGVPFVVLGDFNRVMDGRDDLLTALNAAAPLTRATEGQATPCWGGNAFIDHILAGGAARGWMAPNTMRVLVYRETDAAAKERLSDHCPVSVRFRLPD